jgi:hypothetical protein
MKLEHGPNGRVLLGGGYGVLVLHETLVDGHALRAVILDGLRWTRNNPDNSGEDSAIRGSGNGGFRDRQGQPVNDERIGVCHLQRKAQIVCSGTCKKLYRFLRHPQIFPTRQ